MKAFLSVSALATMFFSSSALAHQCGSNYWPGTLPEHEPNSVAVSDLDVFLATFPAAEGIKFKVEAKPGELWIDVLEYPSGVTVAAASRMLFIIGRIADGEFGSLVLADTNEGMFQISENEIRAIGCQFVWGVEGRGENPIALIRQFADGLTYYDSGRRVAAPFNGSLLGDTSKAMAVLNEAVNPQWVLRTVEIK
ncbi:hypothetical protein [Ruegeria sp. HKCCE3926]|uniref:hypothetical protein n=1 Tax=Ruegeria sp. HKCCE3926 TaxID=2794831 RepID=UPI001AE16AAD|nr:hypothetical protein [Ruegeria sp. HKCCE3926]